MFFIEIINMTNMTISCCTACFSAQSIKTSAIVLFAIFPNTPATQTTSASIEVDHAGSINSVLVRFHQSGACIIAQRESGKLLKRKGPVNGTVAKIDIVGPECCRH